MVSIVCTDICDKCSILRQIETIEVSISVMNQVKVVDPELNKFLAIINGSVKKFRSLISEIANIAKIEKDMVAMEMVDIEELVKSIEWSLDDKIIDSGAVINAQLAVKAILFAKKNLRSILFNLVSNAIKFRGDASPVIDIVTEKKGDNVVLSVKDNGIGMANEDKEKNIWHVRQASS